MTNILNLEPIFGQICYKNLIFLSLLPYSATCWIMQWKHVMTSPNSFIEVSVIRKNNSNLTLISIINTCNNAPSFDDNGFPASSKKDKQKHGLGLKSVNRIANKYNGSIKMYYENQYENFPYNYSS